MAWPPCPALLCDHERTSGNSEQQSLVVQYIDIAVGVTSIVLPLIVLIVQFVQTINKLKRERREVFFQIATPLEQRRGAGFSEEELELNSERGQVNDDEKMIGKKNQDEEENEEDEDKKKNELKDGEKEETKSQKAKREAEEKKKAEEEEKKKKKKKDRNGLAPQQIDLLNKINKMSNFIPNSFYVRVVIGIILIVDEGPWIDSRHLSSDMGLIQALLASEITYYNAIDILANQGSSSQNVIPTGDQIFDGLSVEPTMKKGSSANALMFESTECMPLDAADCAVENRIY
ncbi:hypothetical protein BLNAU_15808 [Blattamonas nauphoetae]|uniref:Uncharacterized protein n=1 Tax=Blattamonas nauphoetae TaxID=2049346 RepID=A0ABQ9XCZ0_9EUKA|nr:hypothetical protein BLNAU_15808 [Blattamonas nauphoetae]